MTYADELRAMTAEQLAIYGMRVERCLRPILFCGIETGNIADTIAELVRRLGVRIAPVATVAIDFSALSTPDLLTECRARAARENDCPATAALLLETAKRLEAAEAVVAKLPKTADGVRIDFSTEAPMEVWFVFPEGQVKSLRVTGVIAEVGMVFMQATTCYSTKAAAEAVREERGA